MPMEQLKINITLMFKYADSLYYKSKVIPSNNTKLSLLLIKSVANIFSNKF